MLIGNNRTLARAFPGHSSGGKKKKKGEGLRREGAWRQGRRNGGGGRGGSRGRGVVGRPSWDQRKSWGTGYRGNCGQGSEPRAADRSGIREGGVKILRPEMSHQQGGQG